MAKNRTKPKPNTAVQRKQTPTQTPLAPKPETLNPEVVAAQTAPATALQRVAALPAQAQPADVLALQRTAGNRAVNALLAKPAATGLSIQAKLVRPQLLNRIQRAFQPAVITATRDVRLHSYTVGTKKWIWSDRVGNQTSGVNSAGVETLHPYDRIEADPADTFQDPGCITTKDYTKAKSIANNQGYIKDQHFTAGEQLGATTGWALPTSAGKFRIWDTARNAFITEEVADGFKASIKSVIGNALTSEATTGIEIDKPSLVKNVVHQTMVSAGMGIQYDPAQWGPAMDNIEDRIAPRVARDKNQMVQAGLITQHHDLKKIEFTGADFHKGGQAPVFLYFETNNPHALDQRKVVYKPSNLDVDKALFNRQNSLAQALDNGGNQVSQYTIISNTENGGVGHNGERYGYMEFVNSDSPQDQNDLLGVWSSLGANAALAYLAGLEDIHQENVLLKRSSIQIIDMEATTGRYVSFSAMLWNKAINEGLRNKLLKAANAGTLATAPLSAAAVNAAETAFKDTLNRAQGGAFDNAFNTARDDLAGKNSRLVPIPTAALYQGIEKVKAFNTLNAWQTWIDDDNNVNAVQYVNDCHNGTGSTKPFIKRVLKSPGTYAALRAGDVPYFRRDLGTSRIYDEANNQIDETGCSKVGQDIATEMDTRRAHLQSKGTGHMDQTDPFAHFQQQMNPLITQANDMIRNAIAARANLGQQG